MRYVQVNLRGNSLGEPGWCAVFDTLRDNPQNKIAKWDLSGEGINPTIAKSLAAYAAVSASLTTLDLYNNGLGDEGAKALAPAIAGSASLTALDLASNNLAGVTGYIKASEVQGSSFNVGDKVLYQGREMVLSLIHI